jgi:NADPH:quinone reductase-like Zn-dependent oxidoreductase
MQSMKAVRIHNYGAREALVYEDAPMPEVGEGEVLVRVAASSVNPFDCAARSGYVVDYYPYTFPLTLGLDVSGVIESRSSSANGFQPGDAVYGRANPAKNGAYAEFISLPVSQIARKPHTLDFLQAASVPHVAASAWQALINNAAISAGQTVLIHGAAGGVGTFAVQFAKAHGATVIGTASASHLGYVKSLGADEVIDHNATRFEDVVHDVDVVLDLVGDMGDNTQSRSWKVIKPGGILVSLVQFPSPQTAAEHGVRAAFASADSCDTQFLNEVARLIDAGKLHPSVSAVHPLKDTRLAHEQSEGRHVRGKIVLQVADL